MKRMFLTLNALLLLCGYALAQQNEPNHLDPIKGDFSQAVAVAHVRIKGFKVVRDLGGLYLYQVRALVVDPFKGKLKKGQAIKYYVHAPYAERLRKEWQLVFFKEFMHKGEKTEILELRHIAGENLSETLTDIREIAFSMNEVQPR